jgi:hypothetical protein
MRKGKALKKGGSGRVFANRRRKPLFVVGNPVWVLVFPLNYPESRENCSQIPPFLAQNSICENDAFLGRSEYMPTEIDALRARRKALTPQKGVERGASALNTPAVSEVLPGLRALQDDQHNSSRL